MTRLRSRVRAAALAAVAGLGVAGALVLGGAGSASAHDYLVSTSPSADATVTEALAEVALTFNEPPLTELDAGIAVEVHDPAGATVSSGEVSIVNSTLSVAVAPTTAGSYTVLWQTVSSDGHPVSGEFAFDYQGPAATTPDGAGSGTATTPGAGTTPGTEGTAGTSGADGAQGAENATPAPTASGGPAAGTPGPVAQDTGAPSPVLIGLGAALGVLVLVGIAVTVVLTRRRRTLAGEPADERGDTGPE